MEQSNNVKQTTSGVTGELTFDNKVVQKIIGIGLGRIDGLLTVDGGFFSNVAEKLVNTDHVTAGIDTEVGKKQVAVDMDVVVEFGRDIEEIYNQIKKVVSEDITRMTHLEVVEINVNVVDIKSKAEYAEDSETVQTKLSRGANKTGDYVSTQTNKARNSVNKGVEDARENREPRVE